jgi:hypothetical protein
MPERKPRRTKPSRKAGNKQPREAFHYPPDLKAALESFVESADPPTTKSAVIVAALKGYLGRRGAWPTAAPSPPQQ